MKGILSPVVALIVALLTLISLLSINPTWDKDPSAFPREQTKVSELGLRFLLHN
jgi:hypothetical protein